MYTPDKESRPRLFLALWPDDGVRQAISKEIVQFSHVSAKRVKPENYHITLAFLGNVPVGHVSGIVEELSKVNFSAFDFRIDFVMYIHRSRMLWLTPRRGSEPLGALVKSISQHLESCGFAPERKPFAAHITIARNVKMTQACQTIQGFMWSVSSFCLVESQLKPSGPYYHIRHRWKANS